MVDVSLRLTLWCVPHLPSASEFRKTTAIIIAAIVTFYQKIISFFNSEHHTHTHNHLSSYVFFIRHIWFYDSKIYPRNTFQRTPMLVLISIWSDGGASYTLEGNENRKKSASMFSKCNIDVVITWALPFPIVFVLFFVLSLSPFNLMYHHIASVFHLFFWSFKTYKCLSNALFECSLWVHVLYLLWLYIHFIDGGEKTEKKEWREKEGKRM